MLQTIATFLGMGHSLKRLACAQTLEEQQEVWNSNWFVRFCKQGNSWLVDMAVRFLALIFLNRFVLWYVLQLLDCMASCIVAMCLCSETFCCLKVLLLSAEGAMRRISINNLALSLKDVVLLDNNGPAKRRRIIACFLIPTRLAGPMLSS